jgi:DNA-binding CsgD family transcriptional regulator
MKIKSVSFYARMVAFLLAIAALGIVDFIFDMPHGFSVPHFLVELGIVILGLGGALYLAHGWYHDHHQAESANRSLKQYMLGVGKTIDRQFHEWGLTEAERCTAILVLKGLSHKDIADRCGRSERTVRQHAVAVYRKSGLAGRAELAAYFMEDLLPPVTIPSGGDEETMPTPAHPPSSSAGQI